MAGMFSFLLWRVDVKLGAAYAMEGKGESLNTKQKLDGEELSQTRPEAWHGIALPVIWAKKSL